MTETKEPYRANDPILALKVKRCRACGRSRMQVLDSRVVCWFCGEILVELKDTADEPAAA
jgi:uncharacterized protein (DUF983 family)